MKNELFSDDILKCINIWDTASHLTFLRKNFLLFYHMSIMEVGEGGGKLSRLKCKSLCRLLINFPRELILLEGWKRNAANGPICDTGEYSDELTTCKQNGDLLLGMSYFLGAEYCVYYNQEPKWTSHPHSSLGLDTLSKEQIDSTVRAAIGQAIETASREGTP